MDKAGTDEARGLALRCTEDEDLVIHATEALATMGRSRATRGTRR